MCTDNIVNINDRQIVKEKVLLYIDILGFTEMVTSHSLIIPQIFEIINELSVFRHFAFQTIVFSDTIVVYNKDDNRPGHYYLTCLVEFAQQLFYRLLSVGVFFRGIVSHGEFEYHKLDNIEAYWGNAFIEAFKDEKILKGVGLFVKNDLSEDILTFEKTVVSDNFCYIFLCQSLINLYKRVHGVLPVELELLNESDDFHRIDEDLMFFREVCSRKEQDSSEISEKYLNVYNWYKEIALRFFHEFEKKVLCLMS